jgi:predicted acylesterase/phospholipase RssA
MSTRCLSTIEICCNSGLTVLWQLLGGLVMREKAKSVAVALSGGGFRATLFHLGVIRLLYERDLLAPVGYVGAVSGGSIAAAHLVLNWDRYTSKNRDDFDAAAAELIGFTQADIRGQIVRRSFLAWLMFIPRFFLPRSDRWTIGNLLLWSFDRFFGGKQLKHLKKGAARPKLFLNCTSLTTGSSCFFDSSSFNWYEKKEDKQTGLYKEEPKDVYIEETPVSFAVAASSAFPPLFPPIEVSHSKLVCSREKFPTPFRLTDGGVYDNLGINRLLERTSAVGLLLISDAEGDFDADYEKEFNWPVSRNIRASDLLMTRVSSLQFDVLDYQNKAAQQAQVPQKTDYVRICIKDVISEEDSEKYAKRLTFEQQRASAKIRTDLDAFSIEEVSALILHGYNIAQWGLIRKGVLIEPPLPMDWGRFAAFPPEDSSKLTAKLMNSSKRKWRLFARDKLTFVNGFVLVCLGLSAFVLGRWVYDIAEQNFRAAGATQAALKAATEISNLTAQLQKQQQPHATTTFQVCQGEFGSQCPPNSRWIDCGRSISEITGPMCSSASVTRVSTRDGNRCGYSIDQVFCSFEIPDIAGTYTCQGNCPGSEQIKQSGSSVTCINEKGSSVNGVITGRRSFEGCWGLHADISEDLSKIDWHNGTFWVRPAPK